VLDWVANGTSFMQNNDMPLENLLKTNAKEIFIKSKYKPKSNVK
jgi:hypothetical protein